MRIPGLGDVYSEYDAILGMLINMINKPQNWTFDEKKKKPKKGESEQ